MTCTPTLKASFVSADAVASAVTKSGLGRQFAAVERALQAFIPLSVGRLEEDTYLDLPEWRTLAQSVQGIVPLAETDHRAFLTYAASLLEKAGLATDLGVAFHLFHGMVMAVENQYPEDPLAGLKGMAQVFRSCVLKKDDISWERTDGTRQAIAQPLSAIWKCLLGRAVETYGLEMAESAITAFEAKAPRSKILMGLAGGYFVLLPNLDMRNTP